MIDPAAYLTPKDVARRLDTHVGTIYRWIKSGKLKAKRLAGHRHLIAPEEVDKLLADGKPRSSAEQAADYWRGRGFSVG